MRIVKELMQEANSSKPPLKARNIGIISPFRAQVWKLREMLREEKLKHVDVGTVEVSRERPSRRRQRLGVSSSEHYFLRQAWAVIIIPVFWGFAITSADLVICLTHETGLARKGK
jgi:hypothetical protein